MTTILEPGTYIVEDNAPPSLPYFSVTSLSNLPDVPAQLDCYGYYQNIGEEQEITLGAEYLNDEYVLEAMYKTEYNPNNDDIIISEVMLVTNRMNGSKPLPTSMLVQLYGEGGVLLAQQGTHSMIDSDYAWGRISPWIEIPEGTKVCGMTITPIYGG